VRLQLVIIVESVSELHRPRWEDHPTRALRQLHVGLDGLGGHQIHLIFANDAAIELFELMHPIIGTDRGDA
jgi:hypothetical protein